jgi:hypothetical protein
MPLGRKPCTITVVTRSNQHGQILSFHSGEGPNSKQCLQQGLIARHNHRRSAWEFSPRKLRLPRTKSVVPTWQEHYGKTLILRHTYFSQSAATTQDTSLTLDSTWVCEMEPPESIWSPVNTLGNTLMKVPRQTQGARGCHIANYNVGTMDHTSV